MRDTDSRPVLYPPSEQKGSFCCYHWAVSAVMTQRDVSAAGHDSAALPLCGTAPICLARNGGRKGAFNSYQT